MPKSELTFNKDLTKEKVKQIFTNYFSSKYSIMDNAVVIGTDFGIKKSSFTGIAVKYIYKPDKEVAFISFNAFVPSVTARILLGGLLLIVILLASSWPKITREVKEFIMSSPELKAISKK